MRFLVELTEGMLKLRPAERPKAKEALETFESIVQRVRSDPKVYRWRVIEFDEGRYPALFMDLRARIRVLRCQIGEIPSKLCKQKSRSYCVLISLLQC